MHTVTRFNVRAMRRGSVEPRPVLTPEAIALATAEAHDREWQGRSELEIRVEMEAAVWRRFHRTAQRKHSA